MASAAISGDIDAVQLSHLIGTAIVTATPTSLVLNGGGARLTLGGTGFTYDVNGQLNGGTVTSIEFTDPEPSSAFGRVIGHITGIALPAAAMVGWLSQNANDLAFSTILSGSDLIGGAANGSDRLRGYDGADTIISFDGASDTVLGGAGDDSITASATSADVLNGGPGADTLAGGGGAHHDIFEVGLGESPVALAAGGLLGRLDHIVDWASNDLLSFSGGGAGGYAEITAFSFDQAVATAQSNLALGIDYTVAQMGADVVVFALKAGDAVVLAHRTLAEVSQANVAGGAASRGATVDLFDGADMGTFRESALVGATVNRSSTLEHITFADGAAQMSITGVGLTYDGGGALSGGTVTGVEVTSPNGHFVLTGAHTDGSILGLAFRNNDANLSISSLLAGDDVITARGATLPGADASFTGMGFAGDDLMVGGGSLSTLLGGDGDDTVQAGSATSSYLRGDSGDDSVSGGAGFDDINGNMGNDTERGGAGDDWVVGGKDNDALYGDDGGDVVWGNLGNDINDGGAGNDQVRGGQGDDIVNGGGGDDYVSGDRGSDTISGGLGADIFHSFSDAGVDRVLDFKVSEGDRVMLDPGTAFSLSQVGGDAVIDMGAGAQMILVGVNLSSLPSGWIFEAWAA
jgi:Ca2+-binding RTX toxin-like protein